MLAFESSTTQKFQAWIDILNETHRAENINFQNTVYQHISEHDSQAASNVKLLTDQLDQLKSTVSYSLPTKTTHCSQSSLNSKTLNSINDGLDDPYNSPQKIPYSHSISTLMEEEKLPINLQKQPLSSLSSNNPNIPITSPVAIRHQVQKLKQIALQK